MRRLQNPGRAAAGRRGTVAAALALALAAAAAPAEARETAPREVEVKAAFLFKLFQFVDWPDEAAGGPFRLGVLGDSPIVPVLETLAGREIRGRRLEVHHFRHLGELADCHILYLAGEPDELPQVLARLDGASTLTAGDRKAFAGRGGVVGFYLEAKRVRLAINVEAARRARLRISSKLLRLATVYRGDDDPNGA